LRIAFARLVRVRPDGDGTAGKRLPIGLAGGIRSSRRGDDHIIREPHRRSVGRLFTFDNKNRSARTAAEVIQPIQWARLRERLAAPFPPPVRPLAKRDGPYLLIGRLSVCRPVIANDAAQKIARFIVVTPSSGNGIPDRSEPPLVQCGRVSRNRQNRTPRVGIMERRVSTLALVRTERRNRIV
jgi:hypothetical protein